MNSFILLFLGQALDALAPIASVCPVFFILCLVSCVWKKIRVIIPLNSNYYNPYVSLIYNKHISARHLSKSITQWPCDSQQLAFPRGYPYLERPSPGGAPV